MRNFSLPVVFLAVVQFVNAQTDLINTTLTIPESNIAYIGIQNIFKATLSGDEEYQVKSNLCEIQKAENPNHYIVLPHDIGIDTFSIIQKDKIILRKIFRINYLPLPAAQLGSLDKSHASKDELIAAKELLVKINNCKCIAALKVAGFTLKIKNKNLRENNANISVEGSALSREAINEIRLLSTNDAITFDQIKAMDTENRLIILPSFTLTIK